MKGVSCLAILGDLTLNLKFDRVRVETRIGIDMNKLGEAKSISIEPKDQGYSILPPEIR